MDDVVAERIYALQSEIKCARGIAEAIRTEWDQHLSVSDRERRAATLLLVLADALEQVAPCLRDDTD